MKPSIHTLGIRLYAARLAGFQTVDEHIAAKAARIAAEDAARAAEKAARLAAKPSAAPAAPLMFATDGAGWFDVTVSELCDARAAGHMPPKAVYVRHPDGRIARGA